MKIRRSLLFGFIVLILSGIVSADNENFVIGSVTIKTPAPYQNGAATMKVLITSLNTQCDLTCSWTAPDDTGGPFFLSPQQNLGVEFVSNAQNGQGSVNGIFSITCTEDAWCPGPSQASEQKSFLHTYPYLGDSQCLTTNNYENCIIAESDCPCGAEKSCIDDKGDQNRDVDDRKCATWCGNGIKESAYEICSSCPIDIGRCNLVSCVSGSECEGEYCIHGVCWDKPWKEGDGFCDLSQGENCKNSVDDCACKSPELCNPSAQDVNEFGCLLCGDGTCQESEQGICAADCKWCGDGQCSGNENCKSCETDCGVCESSEVNKEISENIKSGVQEGLRSTSEKQRNLTLGALGLIVLVVIAYIIFRFAKHKKTS